MFNVQLPNIQLRQCNIELIVSCEVPKNYLDNLKQKLNINQKKAGGCYKLVDPYLAFVLLKYVNISSVFASFVCCF